MGVVSELVNDLSQERFDEIVEDLMRRQHERVPEFFVTDDEGYEAAVRRSTEAHARQMLQAVARPDSLAGEMPEAGRLEIQLAVRHGATTDALLRTYRLGQYALLEHLASLLEEHLGRVPASELCAVADCFYRYNDIYMPLATSAFEVERRRLGNDPDVGRLRQIQSALSGDTSVALGYPSAGQHTAVFVTRAAFGTDLVLNQVADAIGSRSLVTRTPRGEVWAWIAAVPAQRVADALCASGLAGAIGLGEGTFTSAHSRARLAARAGGYREGVHQLKDLMIEALAVGGRPFADELVCEELGPLVDDDLACATLAAWFASCESTSATADALKIAPRTVTYRLRRIEAMLGHSIAERRGELETALRLRRLFGRLDLT